MTMKQSRLIEVIEDLEEFGHSFPDRLKIDPHPLSDLKLYVCENCRGVLEHWVSQDIATPTPPLRRKCRRV